MHWQKPVGPRDGSALEEDTVAPAFWFGGDTGDTPDPDLHIPNSEQAKQEESNLAKLAQLIPSYFDKPISPPLTKYLCLLLQCHRSQQLPLELQQAFWPKLLELEYPGDPAQEQHSISDSDFKSLIIEEKEVEALLLGNPIKERHHTILMREEVATEMEEGEIWMIWIQEE